MKFLIFTILVIFSLSAFAKKDVDFQRFSDEMTENIEIVIKNNPQMYEKNKALTRRPASITPEKEKIKAKKKKELEDTEERFETYDYQNTGHADW